MVLPLPLCLCPQHLSFSSGALLFRMLPFASLGLFPYVLLYFSGVGAGPAPPVPLSACVLDRSGPPSRVPAGSVGAELPDTREGWFSLTDFGVCLPKCSLSLGEFPFLAQFRVSVSAAAAHG